MIYDQLARIDTYRPLSSSIDRAIRFIHETDLAGLPLGRCEIDGERVFAIMHEYQTAPQGRSRWESHRQYIDLQLMLSGEEKMLVTDIGQLLGAESYDPAKDVMFYESARRSSGVDVYADEFVIFFPHDGHRATFAVDRPTDIRKLVMKITVD